MAEINGSALSEDSRKHINSMWLLTTKDPRARGKSGHEEHVISVCLT